MKSYCKKYLLFLILLLTFSISGCGEEEQIKVTDTRFSMDTFVKIDAYSDKPGEARFGYRRRDADLPKNSPGHGPF